MIGAELIAHARAFLRNRQAAYRACFNLETPSGEAVMRDLAKFCRAHTSTAHADTHVAARLDGRREVFLRIAHHLNLSEDQIWQLYGRKDIANG